MTCLYSHAVRCWTSRPCLTTPIGHSKFCSLRTKKWTTRRLAHSSLSCCPRPATAPKLLRTAPSGNHFPSHPSVCISSSGSSLGMTGTGACCHTGFAQMCYLFLSLWSCLPRQTKDCRAWVSPIKPGSPTGRELSTLSNRGVPKDRN